MSLEPGFRVAVESDADVLLEFRRAYYDFDGHGFDREKARKALTALLRDAQFGRAWLILDGASAVGYVVVCFGYSLEWRVGTRSSTNSTCRSGIAGTDGDGKRWPLWRTRRGRGIRTLHLEVVRQNAKALELYRRLGFREHHSTFLSKWIAEDFSKPQGRSGH